MSANIYRALKFVFKIDFLTADYETQFELRTGEGDWIPPTRPEGVKTWASTGWLHWSATNISEPTSMGSSDVQVCSLFYNSETDQFLGVPYDCQQKSVKNEQDRTRFGWRRLMFAHTEHDTPLSVVGFNLDHHVLAGRGSSSWMPQLVPPTYDNNQARLHGSVPPRTGLAGDLSVLLGMAALSAAPTRPDQMRNHIINVLRSCFRPPEWRRHNYPSGRNHEAGVVVSVRVDPSASVIPASTLRTFQAGGYGAIIDG